MRIVAIGRGVRETWRDGVVTRMRVSAQTGSTQLTIFEQWCEPGCGAPVHVHAVEEVLTVLAGTADVRVGEEVARLGPGHCVIIPAGHRHAFTSVGTEVLHVEAVLAAPLFEAGYDDGLETPRRWGP